jgi:alpha-L-arabinofuranosidase
MKNASQNRRHFLNSLARLAAGGVTLGAMSNASSSPCVSAADTTAASSPMEQPAHWKSTCVVEVSNPGAAVADICRGQQLEEFNHQFEGGLYAQLIRNPSFEELDDPLTAWFVVKAGSSQGSLSAQTSSDTEMLNAHQQHCVKLSVASVDSGSVALANGGYWGIALRNNTQYKVSFWAKKGPTFSGTLKARLESNDGAVYAESEPFRPSTSWRHFTCTLTTQGVSKVSANNRFAIYASASGDVYIDVVTVMPPTWKDRPNGLRPDLAEKLAALKLRYIQFPGGCTAESASMNSCWNWKNSIGSLEERAGSTRNRWDYKNDLYFGLDDYLQLCEDLGAEPVYVTSAGISENPGNEKWWSICPLDEMQPIIDDILDLLEYCKGPTSTPWGAKRAANGHPEPYNLIYIEIGNENGEHTAREYGPRFVMIRQALLAKYPDLKIMYNGLEQRWALPPSADAPVDFVDQHFYRRDLSGFYDRFDSIDPAWKKVCVAEYASSLYGNGGDVIGNFGDALGDAVFMLGCERNSEKMWWTGYGNYAGFVGQSNFGPCIVWNDAVSCFTTPSYCMQKMLFSDNPGTRVLPFTQNTLHCFWSASVDTSSGKHDVLLKVANNQCAAETVSIALKGVAEVDPTGRSTVLSGALEDENSLENPTKVVPKAGTFAAGASFVYSFPAHSVTVLRIGCQPDPGKDS